jgi:hypothetical protein
MTCFHLNPTKYQNVTSSVLLKTGTGRLKGVMVATVAGSPTIKFWDNTSAATTVLINTFIPTAATMYNFGWDIEYTTGLYITIGGTVDCTVFFN